MTTLESIRRQFPQYDDMTDGDLLMAMHRQIYSDMHPRAFLNSIDGAANAHATIKNPDLLAHWREAVARPMEGEGQAETARRLQGTAEQPTFSTGGRGMELARSGFQGLTFGAGDEIVARGAATLGGQDYSAELDKERGRLEQGRQNAPVASTVAEIGGALALPGMGAGALSQGSALHKFFKAGGAAAAGGAVYGFNAGEGAEDRARNAATTATLAGLVGGAAPAVAGKAKQVYDAASARKAAQRLAKSSPSLDELRAEASRIYAAADNVTDLPRAQFADAAEDAINTATRRGMDADLTPQAATVASRMEDVATTPGEYLSFRELDQLRRKAAVPAGDFTNKTQQSIGSRFIGAIDEYVDNLTPELGAEVKQARDMWSRLAKNDTIEKALEKAQRQASGFENGIRIEFRRILNNPKASRGFTAAEKQIMNEVVQGTPTGNFLKRVGKLGVGLSQQTNMLGASVSALGGFGAGAAIGGGPVGGLLGALALPALGTLAGRASEAGTARAAGLLGDVIRAGGNVAAPQLSGPATGLLATMVGRGGRLVEPLTK